MLDFNHGNVTAKIANEAINAALDSVLPDPETPRPYLGASIIGHECLRKIQWDWRSPAPISPRTGRIFARGHWVEELAVGRLIKAGFRFSRGTSALHFSQLDGKFRGHGDGMIIHGPALPGVAYPCLWECKGLGSKGWAKLEKHGLVKAYPQYADQVAVYQAYFKLAENPAIFTACNMDTMEFLHLLVPYDAVRAQAASDRAVTIIQADAVGETLPRVAADSDDFRCKMCGHRARCWA